MPSASLRYFFAKPYTIRAKDKRMHIENMIDYQIFIVNTVEKSYGFNHTEIRRQRINFFNINLQHFQLKNIFGHNHAIYLES